MDSDRLNKLLTQLANVGVVAGLAILILEIRQNNELTRAQMEQSRSESFLDWRELWITDENLAPLLVKMDQIGGGIFTKPSTLETAERRQQTWQEVLVELEPVERLRAELFITRSYWDLENLYFQYKRGLVSESYWNDRIIPGIVQDAPAWNAVFGGNGLPGRKEFSDEIERILSGAD
ncbi:MAG: hypothetical protein R3315_00830 [Woeseiaceae bacterium]|nr:hypothetical protein [Woeseiaceae bacterium]